MNKMLLLHQGKKKKTVSILNKLIFGRENIFISFTKGKFGCNAPRDIPI